MQVDRSRPSKGDPRMEMHIVKAMVKIVTPKQMAKDIKGGFDAWMISLKSIDLEELRKDSNASTAIKKSKIGEGAGTKVLEILEEYKDVLSNTFQRGLPPRREVDHKIELLLGSTPKSQAAVSNDHE